MQQCSKGFKATRWQWRHHKPLSQVIVWRHQSGTSLPPECHRGNPRDRCALKSGLSKVSPGVNGGEVRSVVDRRGVGQDERPLEGGAGRPWAIIATRGRSIVRWPSRSPGPGSHLSAARTLGFSTPATISSCHQQSLPPATNANL